MSDPHPVQRDILCDTCGYNLRGQTGEFCPECGEHFDRFAPVQPPIPWLHRRRLGYVASYFATAWRIVSRPTEFADEMLEAGYVDPEHASRFRWTTVAVATASVMLSGVPFTMLQRDGLSAQQLPHAIFITIVMTVAGFVFFVLATELRLSAGSARGSSLHDYSGAALAASPLVAVVMWIAAFFNSRGMAATSLLILAVQGFAWWYVNLSMYQKITRGTWLQQVAHGGLLLLGWAGCAMLTMWLIRAVMGTMF